METPSTTDRNCYDSIYKSNSIIKLVIMCGDPTVGKTCIVTRYCTGMFNNQNIPTIGGKLSDKLIKVEGDKSIRAQIWDTAGQEKYKSIISMYFLIY
jgi:Ras-related protein Rab-11B